MNKCIKCGSYAFNLHKDNIDQGSLCDVHYWQGRAHRAGAQPEQEPVALVIDGVLVKSELPEKYTGHLYTTPPQRTEQNFCQRCGKRTKDLTHIHTCTPPQRTWVGLTIDETEMLSDKAESDIWKAIELAEAKLKEKNG